jgi:hypothetical protein
MCVTWGRSRMADTRIFVGKALHPVTGRIVHTLIYNNRVQNLEEEGNAMILHLPTDEIQQGNLLDLTNARNLLEDMAYVDSDVLDFASSGSAPVVFAVGSYHVVVARRACDIPEVLEQVPEQKRPRVNQPLLEWYDSNFGGGCFILACFDGKNEIAVEPFGVWYEPWQPDILRIPLLDAHDGRPPTIGESVDRDHTVFVGDTDQELAACLDRLENRGSKEQRGVVYKGRYFKAISYSDSLSPLLQGLLPKYICEPRVEHPGPNADALVNVQTWSVGSGLVKRSGLEYLTE